MEPEQPTSRPLLRAFAALAAMGLYAGTHEITERYTARELTAIATAQGMRAALERATVEYRYNDCYRPIGRVYDLPPGRCAGIDAWLAANGLRMSRPTPPAPEPVPLFGDD